MNTLSPASCASEHIASTASTSVAAHASHYRNLALCRVSYYLSSVFFRALGKVALCRVPRKKPSVKENTRQRSSLPSVFSPTLDKDNLKITF
jgi:hypothetical protein